jgi:beta-glucanase (GH16 family)
VNAGDTTTANIRLAIWELAWSDEFDGTEIDRDRWNIFEGGTGVPDQLHWASPDEVLVGDGILRLRSRKRELNGFHYTSGDVNSRYFQQYGRFEVRARLPRGQGIWPAHWLWPVDAGTPEIDIMEMLGNVPNIIHMTYHFQDQKGDRLQSGMIFNGPDFSQDFHTFCVEWYPDEIRWLIDGVERFRTANIDPPKPLHIILDTYIGGNWPGDPDSTTIFPQYHDIDYVRVYRSAE